MSETDASVVVRRVVEGLNSLGLEYVIGGSFASSAWGQFRPTYDLDLAVAMKAHDIDRIVREFEADFAISRNEIESASESGETYASFQLLHFERLFKVDAFLMNGSAFALSEFERRREIELLPGLVVYVATPEDIILQKLRWYELGNRVSDRQWNDIVQVIQVQGDALDRGYVLDWAGNLGLTELANEALAEAEVF